MAIEGKFQDLLPRLLSGLILAWIGLGAIWIGGWAFVGLAALIVGLMVWELQQMLALPGKLAIGPMLAALAGLAVLLWGTAPFASVVLPLAVLPLFLGAVALPRHRALFAVYAAFMILSGFGLLHLREVFGAVWMFWLVLVVVCSDVFGYFAGRIIGGPKFWPKVSPKKTWSGTLAGWLAAVGVAAVFIAFTNAGWGLAVLSVFTAMAAQLGDVVESAVKRLTGVKDASNIIPGHGGVMDRFDAMLGASVFVLLTGSVVDLAALFGG